MKTILAFLLALFVVGYGLNGVLTDHLYIPLKRNGSVILTGTPAMVMFLGFLSLAVYLIAFGLEELEGDDGRNKHGKIKWPALVLSFVLIIAAKTL